MGWPEYEAEMRKRAGTIARSFEDEGLAEMCEDYCSPAFVSSISKHERRHEFLEKFFGSYGIREVVDSLEECSKEDFPRALEALLYQMVGEEDTTETPELAKLFASEHGLEFLHCMNLTQSFAYVKDGVTSLANICKRSVKYKEEVLLDYLLHNNRSGLPAKMILNTLDTYKERVVTHLTDEVYSTAKGSEERDYWKLFSKRTVINYLNTDSQPKEAVPLLTCFLVDNERNDVEHFAETIGKYTPAERNHIYKGAEVGASGLWTLCEELDDLTDLLKHEDFKHIITYTRGDNRTRLLGLGFNMLCEAYEAPEAAHAMAVTNEKGKKFYNALQNLMEKVPDQDWIWDHVFKDPQGIGPRTVWSLPSQYQVEQEQNKE